MLAVHRRIADRVLWLETHASGEPGENAKLKSHVHDIVEHLFRGSQQAHTGAAPFGHLAAHYWQMEHDDPATKGNYEFHRKMRVLRERIGASRPVADIMNRSYRGINGRLNYLGIGASGPGAIIDTKGFRSSAGVGYTPPASPHLQYVTYGSVFQPFMFPGDPGRYDSHFAVHYNKKEEDLFNEEGVKVGESPEVDRESPDGFDAKMASETSGKTQTVNFGESISAEAVNVGFFNEFFSKGGAVQAHSRRWDGVVGGYTFLFDPTTRPDAGLDGDSRGVYFADTSGTVPVPDDIFVWADRQYGPISLYPEASPFASQAQAIKNRIWARGAKEGKADKCGIYGGMWYEAEEPTAFTPRTDWPPGKFAYFPCDFLQSPGPPVDYGYTEGNLLYEYLELEVDPPAKDAVITSPIEFDRVTEDPGKPLRTFDEALAIFEEIKGEPIFRELLAFWARHSEDFHRSGSPFNHGWRRISGVSIEALAEGGEPTGKAEYLQRYGYCHLRGRLTWQNRTFFENEVAWTLRESEGPQPIAEKSEFFKGSYLDFMCNSNIGPVRVRLRRVKFEDGEKKDTSLVFPDWGIQYGFGSESNIAWIDLDGISYPCEEI